MTDEERDMLLKQLVKLGDILGTGDLSKAEHAFYTKEYTAVAKRLFPEQYSRFEV